jgi:hypothetical protein
MYEKLKANNVGYCNNRLLPTWKDRKVWRTWWRQYEMNEEDKGQDADGDNRKRDFESAAAIKLPRTKTIRRNKSHYSTKINSSLLLNK